MKACRSGAIVLGGRFGVFGTGGSGVSSTLTFGEYPTADAMNSANDAIQAAMNKLSFLWQV